jgi:hypothetical protein
MRHTGNIYLIYHTMHSRNRRRVPVFFHFYYLFSRNPAFGATFAEILLSFGDHGQR